MLCRQLRHRAAVKDLASFPLYIRLKTVFRQVVVVAAQLRQILLAAVQTAIEILSANPLVKTMLRYNFVPQIPLAVITAAILLGHHLRQGPGCWRQLCLLGSHAERVRIHAGHNGCARSHAHRLAYIRSFEYETLLGQGIEMGSLDGSVTITRHRIEPLLVGKNKQEIGSVFHGWTLVTGVSRLCHEGICIE